MIMQLSQLFRWFPNFKGKKRLGKILFGKYVFEGKDIYVKGAEGVAYILPNIIENIGYDIFVNGVYEAETIRFICRRIRTNGSLLDIGANIGAICIPIKTNRNDVSVIAIEASPKVYAYLKRNLVLNNLDILSYNLAVAEQSGRPVKIFSPDDLYGKGSQSAVYTQQAESVESITINELARRSPKNKIDFIKIDIEGYEYYAFKGGDEILSTPDAPDILFEFNFSSEDHARGVEPGDAQRLLKRFGYDLYKFGKNGELQLQPDILVSGSVLLFATKKKY